MNLVQKLPIGLSLACVLMLSSCSKEDGSVPEPQMKNVNAHSSLRDGGGVIALPLFPSTNGATGLSVYPNNWQRKNANMSDILAFPSGTSSFTHMWGNPALPWLQPLPALPTGQASGTVVTLTSSTAAGQEDDYGNQIGGQSHVATKIKYLIPGKKYSITFYGASTIPKVPLRANDIAAYSKQIRISYSDGIKTYGSQLILSQNLWSSKTITFEAKKVEAEISFVTEISEPGEYVFANLFVDKNSIKKLN